MPRAVSPPLARAHHEGRHTARRTLRARSSVTGVLTVLVVSLGLSLGNLGAAQAGTTRTAPFPAFPLDELEPGTVGYALTAAPGDVIERFPVTVIALQYDLGPGLPLVLVRVEGPFIDAIGGVAAGMSGSPVYLPHARGEALLGALAYVFPESDARLALVTPIDAMREGALDWGDGPSAGTFAPHADLGANGVVPIATPLAVAGLGARALALLDQTVLSTATHALRPVQAGGASRSPDAARQPVPGSAVAVALVRGDITIAVVGTVTDVTSDALLAFGHPFLGVGPTSWPLVPATVTAIVPSRVVPFKLANVGGELLGTVVQDGPAGIAAALGEDPEMVAVTVGVTTGSRHETLRFDVVADERVWPVLLAISTLEAIDRTWRRTGSGTADIAWEIDLPGGPPLRLTERTAHAVDVSLAAARLASLPLAILATNAFQEARPTAVQVAITIDERRRDAEVVEVLVDGEVPVAGGWLSLMLRLQPWRRASEVKAFYGRLPADLSGDLELRVRGGGEARDENDVHADDVLLSYGELLTALRERPQGADLVVEIRAEGGPWNEIGRLALPYVIQGARTLSIDVAPPGEDADVVAPEGDDNVSTGDDP